MSNDLTQMCIDALISKLTDTNPAIRAKAIEALGEIGGIGVIKILIDHLEEEKDTSVTLSVIDSLVKIVLDTKKSS